MTSFRKIFLALSVVFFSMAVTANNSAQANRLDHVNADVNGIFYYNGYNVGVPYGYGYFNPYNWPVNYWVNPYYNGYSFYPFYNYAPYYASFAAISYSPSRDVFGYSVNESSRNSATYTANNFCGVGDCRPVVWVQGACAVAVTSASTRRLTWAYNNSIQGANFWALKSCANDGSSTGVTDCVARVWVCSY
jgi:Domain of unknown function (DUF4189)